MMNRDSMIDYLSCILFRAFGFLIRKLPLSLSFFLGARLGDLICFLDARHRAVAYANVKAAFGDKLDSGRINNKVREFYRAFGQTLIEFFLFPMVDKKYLEKYITFDGLDNISLGFKRGKGVILAIVHEGSWEISNIISANLGYPFNIVVRDQKRYQRLNNMLNSYRRQKGTKIIEAGNQTRRIIEALKKNEAVAMTVDQGGRKGALVKFFGRNASMSTGAVRLALRYGAAIVPVFSARLKGSQHIKFIIAPPFEIKETQDAERDVQENLQRLISLFEKYIATYPKEYLWTYKIWKYSDERNILILSDNKTGHLRQAQSAANIICGHLRSKNISADIRVVEVKFRRKSCHMLLDLCAPLRCIRSFLREDVFLSLERLKPDVVISCGSSLAALNLIIARENLAKSVVIMRPSILSMRKFDLVIMSLHDNPPKAKNIVAIEGALNLINEDYLKLQAHGLTKENRISKKFVLGLLVGGDTKDFRLNEASMKEALTRIKSSLDKLDGEILVTTSRRTSKGIESLLKEEFAGYPSCRLLVIANEKNMPEAVGGILGLADIIITSPESISMISEAVSSKKYVLVLGPWGVSAKHRKFLELFAKNRYIYLTEPGNLCGVIENLWDNKPKVFSLNDNLLVDQALKKVL